MAESNESGGLASKTAVNKKGLKGMAIEQIDYACGVMTNKYNIEPRLARSCFSYDSGWVRRHGRRTAADQFRKEYTYGSAINGCNDSNDRKTCIWPGDTLSWKDESSGTTWIGVHGADSICVVTRTRDLDATRLRGKLLHHWPINDVFFQFRKSLIVEIEDLEDAYSKSRQRFHQKIENPFGVVSVIPDANKAPSGEMKAIEFLQEKLNSDTIFTVNETIQTAFSAIQHLFQKEFKPDEIQVSVVDPEYTSKDNDLTVEDLNIDQIKVHLDVINKPVLPCHKRKYETGHEDFCSGSRMEEWKLHSCSGGLPETGSLE